MARQCLFWDSLRIPRTVHLMSAEAIRIVDSTVCWGKNSVFAYSWQDAACIDKEPSAYRCIDAQLSKGSSKSGMNSLARNAIRLKQDF
jgi:hypothetical protein